MVLCSMQAVWTSEDMQTFLALLKQRSGRDTHSTVGKNISSKTCVMRETIYLMCDHMVGVSLSNV